MGKGIPITGILLAGGKSSRMGRDKGLIYAGDKTFTDIILEKMKPAVDALMIIANNDEYCRFGIPVIKDIIPDRGPLGGIYTGLHYSKTEWNMILSCDIPFVNTELLYFLIQQINEYDVIIPVHYRRTEPLCALYRKSCKEKIRMLLEQKKLKVKDAVRQFNVHYLKVSGQSFYNSKLFDNINTGKELQDFRSL